MIDGWRLLPVFVSQPCTSPLWLLKPSCYPFALSSYSVFFPGPWTFPPGICWTLRQGFVGNQPLFLPSSFSCREFRLQESAFLFLPICSPTPIFLTSGNSYAQITHSSVLVWRLCVICCFRYTVYCYFKGKDPGTSFTHHAIIIQLFYIEF